MISEGPGQLGTAEVGPPTGGRTNRAIFSGVVAGLVQTVVSLLVAFLQTRLILRALPVDLAGLWFVFVTLAGYISFFDFGLSPTITREIGFALGREAPEQARRDVADLVATAVRIFLGLALLLLLVALTLGDVYIRSVAPAGAEVHAAWRIFGLGTALNLLGSASFAVLYGMGQVSVDRWIRSVVQLLGLGLAYLALARGLDLTGLVWTWVVQGVLLCVSGWWILLASHPWLRGVRGQATLARARGLFLPSVKTGLTAFGAVLILNTQNVVIASALGPAQVPDFTLITRMVAIAATLALLVVGSSAPFISRAHAAEDLGEVKRLLLRNVRLSTGFMVVLVAVLLVYGDALIDLWVGPGHFAGYGVLVPFLVLLTLETHHVAHASVVMATGRLPFHWWAIGAGVLNLALSFLLVHPLGVAGVALGTMLAQLLTNNWYAPYYAMRAFGVPVRPYLREVALPLLALLLAATGVAWALRLGLEHLRPGPLPLLFGAALSGLLGFVLAAFIVADQAERAVLLTRLRRFAPRGVL